MLHEHVCACRIQQWARGFAVCKGNANSGPAGWGCELYATDFLSLRYRQLAELLRMTRQRFPQ